MFISMNWISDFIDLSGIDLKQLIGRFTLSTAEVEDIYEYGKDISDVVIGKIVSIENHPNSEKLHILKVNIGTEIVPCVCGAANIFLGAIIPFAKNGGLVKGIKIESSKVAGINSFGMCCSEKELGISEDNSGVMILEDKYVLGQDIKEIMQLEDTVFEVDNKSLTNRPDLWGHYGIAREIAVLTKRPLKPIEQVDSKQYENHPPIDVKIEDTKRVFRYSCISVNNVKTKTSPINMKIRLNYCGMRPINFIADLTNYLMLELGQPMHAFDNKNVKNICVKTFDKPITFETLDNVQRSIDTETLMICNSNVPIAIAGIMGGEESEIKDDTTSLLLESANFDGVSIRKSATKLGLRTEASARYEKILDPELTTVAINRFLKLLLDIDGEAEVTSSLTDKYVQKYGTIDISFDKAYVDKYTGIDISSDEIETTLKLLQFDVKRDDDKFHVVVPSFRATKDITIKADIIEEITRIYGYDNFELKSANSLLAPVRQDKSRENEYKLKQILADRYALNEVHSYIWYDNKSNKELSIAVEDNVSIINSVVAENDIIRKSMIPTLLGFVNKNIDSYNKVGIFEAGRIVDGLRENGLCDEKKYVGLVIARKNKTENEVFLEVKGIMDYLALALKNKSLQYCHNNDEVKFCWVHPKNSAVIKIDGVKIGYLSVLNPRISDKIDKKANIVVLEFDYSLFADSKSIPLSYKEVSKFPSINVDLSLLVKKEMLYAEVLEIIKAYECEHLNDCSLIGIYEDDKNLNGKKSVTVRLNFLAFDRTLLSDEVNNYTKELLDLLKIQGIEIRNE